MIQAPHMIQANSRAQSSTQPTHQLIHPSTHPHISTQRKRTSLTTTHTNPPHPSENSRTNNSLSGSVDHSSGKMHLFEQCYNLICCLCIRFDMINYLFTRYLISCFCLGGSFSNSRKTWFLSFNLLLVFQQFLSVFMRVVEEIHT